MYCMHILSYFHVCVLMDTWPNVVKQQGVAMEVINLIYIVCNYINCL